MQLSILLRILINDQSDQNRFHGQGLKFVKTVCGDGGVELRIEIEGIYNDNIADG